MTQVTTNGRKLAEKIYPITGFGYPRETRTSYGSISEICSLITRHAASLDRINEVECNEPLNEGRVEYLVRRRGQLEARVFTLANALPGGFGVIFNGDPRSCAVKLTKPGYEQHYDDWGKEGICVEVS